MRIEDTTLPGRYGNPRGVFQLRKGDKPGLFAANVWIRLDGKIRCLRLGTYETAAAAGAIVETILDRLCRP